MYNFKLLMDILDVLENEIKTFKQIPLDKIKVLAAELKEEIEISQKIYNQ